ncbi:hypothetical protein [Achromobacter arsenitoxydans]|uniref:Uncharacterized protein n=1 Tax=Achromobacter arsenitoxydans SY8 TaxID=477184 RepID=H0F227_9BURK|nr:hypothetical protein [Achromobacter arsenitoxydans]EHK67684.1 hypothetical protein KYC_04067 [Achromobacter arsenitoxydans SY8]
MQYISSLLQTFYLARSILGRVIRWATYLTVFLIGLCVFGPFLSSAAFQSLIDHTAADPLLRHVLDPGDWIIDQLVRHSAVLFAVWAFAFGVYGKFKDTVADLNACLGYASILTRGIGTFLFTMFMLLAGIGMYPVLAGREAWIGFSIVMLAFCGFGVPGLFFSWYNKVGFTPHRLLDAVAPYAAVLCAVLAVLAIVYGAVADLLGLVLFLLKNG